MNVMNCVSISKGVVRYMKYKYTTSTHCWANSTLSF